jgi:pyridoxine kinase
LPVLSIQSRVVTGHVGNSAAVPALQQAGIEVWPLDTVVFSNHPAHGRHSGRTTRAAELAALLDGIAARGLLGTCDAVLSGYLGQSGPVVADAIARIQAENKRALYLCDPVLGDDGRLYVSPDNVDFIKDNLILKADIATPNVFEAGLLTGSVVQDEDSLASALSALQAAGPDIVAITGFRHGSEMQCFLAAGKSRWRIATPALDVAASGAGDLFAALLLAGLLRQKPPETAFSEAVSAVHTVLSQAAATGAADLPIIAADGVLAAPPQRFDAIRLE